MKTYALVALSAIVLAVSSPGAPVTSAEAERLCLAIIHDWSTGFCNVHHIRMHPEMVPIHWGLIIDQEPYYSTEMRSFPHARQDVNGGCSVDERLMGKKAPTWVCPECKRAKKRWALRHRSDSQAQWILAAPRT